MGSENKILPLILFIIICFVILNQLVKLTVFAYNYYNIYAVTNINKILCGNYYNEVETERFNISKNIYNLHIDDDIYNSKLYIILVYILSIILYIYSIFILASAFTEHDISEEKLNIANYIIIGFLVLFTIVYFIRLMVLRFDGNDGYKKLFAYDAIKDNNGNSKYAGEVMLYFAAALLIFIKLALIGYFNYNENEIDVSTVIYMICVSLFYIFALFFMNNLFNIVLSFKTNEYPLTKTEAEAEGNSELTNRYSEYEYNDIDISYGSENYFYKRYLLNNEYFDIFKDFLTKRGIPYNISKGGDKAIYTGNIRNYIMIIFSIIIGIIGIYLASKLAAEIIPYDIFDNDNFTKYGKSIFNEIITPLLIIFIVLFVIVATMEYNTFINKDILIDINNKYKEDINKVNNSLLPYLYTEDKKTIVNTDVIKNSFIIHNVVMSYAINTIDIFEYSSGETGDVTIDGNERIYTYKYTIKPIESSYDSKYNINETDYNTIINNLTPDVNITKDISFTPENFNDHVSASSNYIMNYIKNGVTGEYTNSEPNVVGHIDNICKFRENIYDKNDKINNKNDIIANIKNNILASMYNYDNDLKDDDVDNDGDTKNTRRLRNYIFHKDLKLHKFFLKSNIKLPDKLSGNFDIYESYIDTILDEFIDDLEILNSACNKYKTDKTNESLKTTIKNTFDLIISNPKETLDKMIKDISDNKDIESKLSKIITSNYEHYNKNDDKISIEPYEIIDKKITKYDKDIQEKDIANTPFDKLLKNEIKLDKDDPDIIKNHKDMLDNSNYVINERLYVLISTYVISLIIVYMLIKN